MPGGMSGLQIRVGLRAGLRWVRLPLSSATFMQGGVRGIWLCTQSRGR